MVTHKAGESSPAALDAGSSLGRVCKKMAALLATQKMSEASPVAADAVVPPVSIGE